MTPLLSPAPSPYAFPQPYSSGALTLAYTLAEAGHVQVSLYNERADLAAKLDEAKAAGLQTSVFDASHFAPGVYLYAIHATYDSGRSESFGPGRLVKVH